MSKDYQNAFNKNIRHFFAGYAPDEKFYQPSKRIDKIKVVMLALCLVAVVIVCYYLFEQKN